MFNSLCNIWLVVMVGFVVSACKSRSFQVPEQSAANLQAAHDDRYSVLLKVKDEQKGTFHFVSCLGALESLDHDSCVPALVDETGSSVEYGLASFQESLSEEKLEELEKLRAELAKDFSEGATGEVSLLGIAGLVPAFKGLEKLSLLEYVHNHLEKTPMKRLRYVETPFYSTSALFSTAGKELADDLFFGDALKARIRFIAKQEMLNPTEKRLIWEQMNRKVVVEGMKADFDSTWKALREQLHAELKLEKRLRNKFPQLRFLQGSKSSSIMLDMNELIDVVAYAEPAFSRRLALKPYVLKFETELASLAQTSAPHLGRAAPSFKASVAAKAESRAKLSRKGKLLTLRPPKGLQQVGPYVGWAASMVVGMFMLVAIVEAASSKTFTELDTLLTSDSSSEPQSLVSHLPYLPVSVLHTQELMSTDMSVKVSSVQSVLKSLALHAISNDLTQAAKLSICLPSSPLVCESL